MDKQFKQMKGVCYWLATRRGGCDCAGWMTTGEQRQKLFLHCCVGSDCSACARRRTQNAFQISTLQTASSPSSAFYLQTVENLCGIFQLNSSTTGKIARSLCLSTVAYLSAELLCLRRNFVPRGEGQAWEGNGLTRALDLLVAQCLSRLGISTFACVFTVSSNLCMGFLGLTNMI